MESTFTQILAAIRDCYYFTLSQMLKIDNLIHDNILIFRKFELTKAFDMKRFTNDYPLCRKIITNNSLVS